MKTRLRMFTVILGMAASSASAEGLGTADHSLEDSESYGTLNPDDTGKAMVVRKIQMGMIDSVTCSLAINVTKGVDHDLSRSVTKACAEAGVTKAMTWMSQLDNNGLGGDYDPDASAEWDRRAAEAGDPIGKFNHGLNLMRGHGIAQDDALGRGFVDQAAQDGLQVAKRLQGAGYDLDEVTPDADNWKYAPLF